METLYETLKVILPPIMAGLFTFFITKYTYHKNRPLDKLEIAYNRIYYPIYKIISAKNISIDEVINKSNIYLLKYNKYVDISTRRIFESLCKCKKENQKTSIYQRFKDNIYNRSSYLRRRLGYLEPNIVQLYKYSAPSTKSLIRITIDSYIIYITLSLCGITVNWQSMIFTISAVIALTFILKIFFEIIWCLLRFLYYKIG